jgi:hypothetical protein
MRRTIPIVLLAACASVQGASVLDAYARLYNFDFPGAHQVLDTYIATTPKDPLGYSTRAAAYLFFELDRLKILQGEFLTDDKKISGDDKLVPDPAVRARFFAAVEEAQRVAEVRLQEKPGDSNALFAFCITEGLKTDYTAFIEKRQLRSLASARKSHNYAVELLQRDPTFVDAKLTTGITEYMVGSLPFFIRWFVKFDQTQGSKQQAVLNLETVAQHGRYLGPFARILLSIIHLREKRAPQSLKLLEGLVADYPGNRLLRSEMEKLRSQQARKMGTATE